MSRLNEVVKGYIQLNRPEYALLVQGPWGSGKTYQLKELLPAASYVSLFGLSSKDQIDSAILYALLPLSQKVSRTLELLKNLRLPVVGDSLGAVPKDFVIEHMRRNAKIDAPIFIDDIERSDVPTSLILGVIDYYLQKGAHIIVATTPSYFNETNKELKEKTFGRTVNLTPQVSEFTSAYLAQIVSNYNFSSIRAELIKQISRVSVESRIDSLRVVKYALEDVNRFVSAAFASSKDCASLIGYEDALVAASVLLFCFSLEVHANKIGVEELKNRKSLWIRHVYSSDSSDDPIASMIRRYGSVNIGSDVLSDGQLIATLIDNSYDPVSICSELVEALQDNSESLPAWRVIWNFWDHSDEDVEIASSKILQRWNALDFDDLGTFLHEAAALLFLASVFGGDLEPLTSLALQTIDRLQQEGRLSDHSHYDSVMGDFSNNGYSFLVRPETESSFLEIKSHLKQVTDRVQGDAALNVMRQLMRATEAGAEKLSEFLSSDPLASRVPFLQHVFPEDFVNYWTSLSGNGRRLISTALEARSLRRSFDTEKGWLRAVISLVDTRTERSRGLDAIRLRGLVGGELRARVCDQSTKDDIFT